MVYISGSGHAWRKKPKISYPNVKCGDEKQDSNNGFCLLFPLIVLLTIVVTNYVISAISRTTSNSGSEFDQIVCYGTFIFLSIMVFLGIGNIMRDMLSFQKEKKKWAKECTTTQLTIVSCHEADPTWDDYANDFVNAHSTITLEMNSEQKAIFPNETRVNVIVSSPVFSRLKERDKVRVFYMADSPLNFLLEEEI